MSLDLRATIEAIWRIERTKIVARLTRIVRDVTLAEDLAQDAFVAALERWSASGLPENPGAWLTTTAKNKAFDALRRGKIAERTVDELGHDAPTATDARLWDDAIIDDDVLRLTFMACHPILSTEARVALTLKLIGGLTTEEISRAYLSNERTIAQRIVRAKKTLTQARAEFEVPERQDIPARVASVLEVIYLIFNEGYSATSGDVLLRPDLCYDALRLGRGLAQLLPHESEVHGLVALMEIQSSRLRARVDAEGEPILLADQNRDLWDKTLIVRGLKAIEIASSIGAPWGPYLLQAAIASCHARARTYGETDWERIVLYYDALANLKPNAVVGLNRAVAVSMAYGPEAGLEALEPWESDGSLSRYHLLPSVKGDFLFRLGRKEQARRAFLEAATLTSNARERSLLERRARDCLTET